MRLRVLSITAALLSVVAVNHVQAQGLIWNLPPDGSWVRYEGTYSQLVRRPNSTEGDLTLEWTRHLTIKSVGTSDETIDGEVVPCRWIEIKVVTAQPAALLEPGPGGNRIYKILVPERAILGRVNDDANILVSFIPVVRGYRVIGEEDPEPIESGVFQIYPLVSYLRHYRELQADSDTPQQTDIPMGIVSAIPLRGAMTVESAETRSTNEAELWRSDDVPFGLAKWTVRDLREEKHTTQSRDLFRETMEVSIEMSAHESGINAVTELDVQ
ncbi:MAG: hypothetical protein R3B91_00595 [Planctomycetaceae bacterium]|nr:hypothetical protein [Planctomycetaceae bacterium]